MNLEYGENQRNMWDFIFGLIICSHMNVAYVKMWRNVRYLLLILLFVVEWT